MIRAEITQQPAEVLCQGIDLLTTEMVFIPAGVHAIEHVVLHSAGNGNNRQPQLVLTDHCHEIAKITAERGRIRWCRACGQVVISRLLAPSPVEIGFRDRDN